MKPVVVMVASPIHAIPPHLGAAVEWWMWQVSRRLQGWSPHIICTWAEGYKEEEVRDGVALHRLRLGRLYKRWFQKITRLDPWGYAARAAARIERLGTALVHVHNDPGLFRELRRRSRDPARHYLLHLHNERDNLEGLERAELVVVSQYLADWYQERLPGARIRIVTNGVDLEQFTGLRASEEERRMRLPGLDPAVHKVVLYAGRISPEKGTLSLVQAMPEVLRRRGDVALVLAGEFSNGRPDSRRVIYGAAVREALAQLPVGRGVSLGAISPDQMDKVFACADLVVMPSEFQEPLGMVALEAMAAGAPLLVARRGGLREIVREGETGYFIPEDGDHPLARRIVDLLGDEESTHRMIANARHYVADRHNWDRVCREMEDVYERD